MFATSLKNLIATLCGVALCLPLAAQAGGVTYQDGDKYLKIGGRIQMQYHHDDPDGAYATDEMFFRRLRPYIEGSIHKDWLGKFQWDMGKAEDDNELAIKDAYVQYKGIKGMKVTVGNANFPFSRELLTSSKTQQLVERTFVGDHNYGTPDRQPGVHVTGAALEKKFEYAVSLASACIDPDAKKLDFDTPVNRNDDFNEGWILGGRVEFHPLGQVKKAQGDFKREFKFSVGAGAFAWNNDDDNSSHTVAGVDDSKGKKPDVDSVTGLELSAALRGFGLSVDAEYNRFSAETVDGAVTSGIYKQGETDLTNYALEGGFMVIPSRLELVAGYQVQDADGYAEKWNRTSIGANWFIKKQDIKLQLSYRMGENLKGKDGNDADELFVQTQYVF
ncbi:MAG: porin [Desulfuromonadales bacterium]|nr:porin [Desulfuromonadales bacterium]